MFRCCINDSACMSYDYLVCHSMWLPCMSCGYLVLHVIHCVIANFVNYFFYFHNDCLCFVFKAFFFLNHAIISMIKLLFQSREVPHLMSYNVELLIISDCLYSCENQNIFQITFETNCFLFYFWNGFFGNSLCCC